MRVLVLGGYGLIGSHVVRRLRDTGRNVERARRRHTDVEWVRADLRHLDTSDAWSGVLTAARCQAIVNCVGVLQDGMRDDVQAVQARSIRALVAAAQAYGIVRFVQISAPRAGPEADTKFMRTKGEADAALATSGLDWAVLRPGLVLSHEAYGGTALLRALAACPLVQPLAYEDALIQTVAVDDIATAVLRCLEGRVALQRTYDLVEDDPHTLAAIVSQLRSWLGVAPAPVVVLPNVAARVVAFIADAVGWLGWRSPLRSTALREIAAGVLGDPEPWRREAGGSLASLESTLRAMPATTQERWFARFYTLKPLIIGTLSLFWLATAIITWANPAAAISVLSARGVDEGAASVLVHAGAVVDAALGLAILHRGLARSAAIAMIIVTIAYLLGATIWASDLWADPLGPLVKAIPAMVLALVALALDGDR